MTFFILMMMQHMEVRMGKVNYSKELLKSAIEYCNDGWAIIPVPYGQKSPAIKGWPDFKITANECSDHWGNEELNNIGCLTGARSNGLVDVDLDCNEAVQMARHLIPKTDRIHGRENKKESHYWYYCDPIPLSKSFQITENGKQKMLVEIRADKHQTQLPPSKHPTGELYEWNKKGKPAQINGDELTKSVEHLAAATYIAIRWPKPDSGLRNTCAMALSGVLLRAGWELNKVNKFIEAVTDVAGDEESFSRIKSVDYTEDRLKKDQSSYGIPKLAEILDSEVIKKISEWLDLKQTAPTIKTNKIEYCPPLPDNVKFLESDGYGSSEWLDQYVLFASKWSPRTPKGFHVSNALWILSTVAARRVTLNFGGARYTPLYIMQVARTSLFAKTTANKIAVEVLEKAELDFLLTPDESTPQKFISDLTDSISENYNKFDATKKELIKKSLQFSGQKGWIYDEFGQHLDSITRANGHMSDFKGILKRFDDCRKTYERATVSRDKEVVNYPYLSLLANLTPADLFPFLNKGNAFWRDGFWARFAFVTPKEGDYNTKKFPKEKLMLPDNLITPLVAFHEKLGLPDVDIVEIKDEDGNKQLDIERREFPQNECIWDDDVYDAYYRYDKALRDFCHNSEVLDFDGNYARFPEKALRIAMLLAALENDFKIEICHWARAQNITEEWRTNLHSLFKKQTGVQADQGETLLDKIVRNLKKHKKMTVSKLKDFIRNVDKNKIESKFEEMYEKGIVDRMFNNSGTYTYFLREAADTDSKD